MSTEKDLLTALLLLILLLCPVSLNAAERLAFDNKISKRSQILINNFIHSDSSGFNKTEIARADLNEDGLDEYLIRESSCAKNKKLCSFKILAESRGEIIELGKIQAVNILLGNDYSGGIRNLLAFKNSENDFEYTLYVWEPDQARYIMTE